MGIAFPQQAEVRLKKSPLREVICQVRFPPLLRIGNETPVNFQEAIRNHYPGLEIEQGVMLQLGINPAMDKPTMETSPKIYRFKSLDAKANVALASDFFAVSTIGYTHWHEFINNFTFIEQIVQREFVIPTITRIGLRFINQFTRKNTGCSTYQELLELFRDDLTCFIRSDAWSEPVETISQYVIPDGKAKLTIRFGSGKEQKELFFILDFDYFEDGQIEFNNLNKRLNRYHNQIYQAFRWCLKESSLNRFEPIQGE
jgi:uncharacterized protein (TIGR04255 family)